MVLADFFTFFAAHPATILNNPTAISAFVAEFTSATVLTTPVPGDLWTHVNT